MAAIAGTITTRVLLAVGDAEPTEIGSLTTNLHATGSGAGVALSARRWRRSLAIAFLRMAWATWTTRSTR
ncbi:hypothetical protein ACIGCK_04840 [Microbacterium sp. NPDC078428]|uniref:hypothetical protein n=1 Tax=Microbacterium sp. NPDC078428 TaxID=3364190 RepID=UPI0037C95369